MNKETAEQRSLKQTQWEKSHGIPQRKQWPVLSSRNGLSGSSAVRILSNSLLQETLFKSGVPKFGIFNFIV